MRVIVNKVRLFMRVNCQMLAVLDNLVSYLLTNRNETRRVVYSSII